MTETKDTAKIRKKLYREFWRGFRDHLENNATRVMMTDDRRGGREQHWMRPCHVGASGFNLVAAHWVREKQIRATLRIETDRCPEFFGLLETKKGEIEQEMGRELTWERSPTARGSEVPTIYLHQDTDLYDKDAWPDQYAWLLNGLEDLHRVFEARIRNLPT